MRRGRRERVSVFVTALEVAFELLVFVGTVALIRAYFLF